MLQATRDAHLLKLGDQLDKASIAFRRLDRIPGATDAQYDQAHARVSKILEKIRTARATSIAGLRVKARAIQECHSGSKRIVLARNPTTDARLAASIVMDLLQARP